MILARHVLRILAATIGYGLSSRRFAVVLLVVIGLGLVGLVTATQVVAPIVVYPFV